MRLIDADRLLEDKRIEKYYHLKNGDIAIPLIDIKHAPTVEERTETHACDCISRQAAIDTEGLDAEIRCEMCTNPMHTDRGCDGHCEYDEKLYEKIMQVFDERIKPLPSAQPEIIRCRECKFASGDSRICMKFDHSPIGELDFCSFAERREVNNESN